MFAEVRPGEGVTALLLMANVFTLLTAYYIIKPVREALILAESSAEVKSYASAGQAALLLLIIPLYGLVARRVNRVWLINGVTAFFISNLVVFFLLGQLGTKLGIVFYLWVGLFNVMIIAQFWAFANDLYSKKKGERLFGLIGIGASIGAILGAGIAGKLFDTNIGIYSMMLVAAFLLGACMILTTIVHRREKQRSDPAVAAERVETPEKPLGTKGGFQLIFTNKYLLAIAFLVLLSNLVNTTGEFILGKTVETHAETTVAAADVKNYIGQFYADFYFWVNLLGAVIQMFAVSRIMQYLGTGAAVLFLPVLALGSYAIIALVPVLSWIRFAKIAENTTDYSVQKHCPPRALFTHKQRSEVQSQDCRGQLFLAHRRCVKRPPCFGGNAPRPERPGFRSRQHHSCWRMARPGGDHCTIAEKCPFSDRHGRVVQPRRLHFMGTHEISARALQKHY
jgi:AAA family ATP:ADP antiporter